MSEKEIKKVKSEDYKVDPYTIDTNDKVLKIEGGRRIETKANMGVFLKLFGDSIYNSDGSAYREQLTNALSHGCLPAIAAGHDAHVEVEIDFNKRRIMVTDVNGMGIPWNLMNEVCTNIGESGNHDRSRSGQHGCGMFSFLKMTTTTILETKSRETDDHYAYICEGGKTWDEIGNRELKEYGTRIQLTVNENVKLEKIIKATRDICQYQDVKTYMTVIGSPSEELNLTNYRNPDKNEWYKGDGTYEFGKREYSEGINELFNGSITDIVKLEAKDMEIFVALPNQKIGSYYGNDDHTRLFLCNVPLSDRINSLGFSTVWVNLTDEKTWKPPVDRDNLGEDDIERIKTYVNDAIADWIKTISIETYEEYKEHEHSGLINVPQIDDKLPEKTRDLFHELRKTWKVWNKSLGKDRSESFGNLLRNGNCFLVKTWNTSYYDAFRRHFGDEEFTFLKIPKHINYTSPSTRKSEHAKVDKEIMQLEKYFEDARDYKIKKGLNLSGGRISAAPGEQTVKTVNVRTPGSWNFAVEKVRISDLNNTGYVKLGRSGRSGWSGFYDNLNQMRSKIFEYVPHNRDRTLYGSDVLQKSGMKWIANNTFAKHVDPLACNEIDFITSQMNNPVLRNIEGEATSFNIHCGDKLKEFNKTIDDCKCEKCSNLKDGFNVSIAKENNHSKTLLISEVTKELAPYYEEYRKNNPLNEKFLEIITVKNVKTSEQILSDPQECKWLVALQIMSSYYCGGTTELKFEGMLKYVKDIKIHPIDSQISKYHLQNTFTEVKGMPDELPTNLVEKLQSYKTQLEEKDSFDEDTYKVFVLAISKMFANVSLTSMYQEHNNQLTTQPTVISQGHMALGNTGIAPWHTYLNDGRWDNNKNERHQSFESLADEVYGIIKAWVSRRLDLLNEGQRFFMTWDGGNHVNFYEGQTKDKPILLTGKSYADLKKTVDEWQKDGSFEFITDNSKQNDSGIKKRTAYRLHAPLISTKNIVELDSKRIPGATISPDEVKLFTPKSIDKYITKGDLVVKINAGKENESNVRLSAYEDLYDSIQSRDPTSSYLKKGEGRMLDFNFVEILESGEYNWSYLKPMKIFSEDDINRFLEFLNTRYSSGFNTYRSNNWKTIIFNLSLEKECWNDLIENQPIIEKITWSDKNKFTVELIDKITSEEIEYLQRNSDIFGSRNTIDIEVENGKMVIKHEIDYPRHCEN